MTHVHNGIFPEGKKGHHCCLTCGWVPVEGMNEYRTIQGNDATCLQCGANLVELPDELFLSQEPT